MGVVHEIVVQTFPIHRIIIINIMSDLTLLDAVTVKAAGSMPAMDGVIAYLDQGKKIGVRLTGSSVGLGDHSGSMDGIDYFDCPLNSGLFVEREEIEIRRLSRIEELRLKRELAAGQLQISRTSRKPPVNPNPNSNSNANQKQAIAPKAAPPSVSLKGLSPSALDRLQELNQTYMQETIGPSTNDAAEDEDDELLISDNEQENETIIEEEEDHLQINREHVNQLRQRKEEIQSRKEALKQGTSSSTLSTRTDEEDAKIADPPMPAKEEEEEEENQPPLSRLEALKMKKRNLESSTSAPSSSAAPPPAPYVEQVPWPDDNHDPTPAAAAVAVASQSAAIEAVAEEAQPLSRLELLKLKKRELEEAPEVQQVPPKSKPQAKEQTQPQRSEAMSTDSAPMATVAFPTTTTAATTVPEPQPPPPPPKTLKMQVINSSSKRMKEFPVNISPEINLYDAVYDNDIIKQANIRKWGTSFVEQVRSKKSEISCRLALIPNRQSEAMILPMDIAIAKLKEVTTKDVYQQYGQQYDPTSSIVQMVLLCKPIHPPGAAAEEAAASSSLPPPKRRQVSDSLPASVNIPTPAMKDVSPKPDSAVRVPTEPQPEPPAQEFQAVPQQPKRVPSKIKHQLRVKIINDSTKYFKDLLVETTDKMNLHESIYNNPGVKQARVRKWGADTVDQVREGMAEIVCQICTIPNGRPEHLVKHGALTIEQLKETTTEDLYTKYAFDYYDPDNEKSMLQLILQCQQITTPQASNNSAKQSELAAAPMSVETPPSLVAEMDKNQSQTSEEDQILQNGSNVSESSRISFNSLDRKATAHPYAKAAVAALPMHDTKTKFSDLLEKPKAPKKQPEPVVEEEAEVEVSLDDVEKGNAVLYQPSPARTADAEVQTFEMQRLTTPTTDNRRPRPQQQPNKTFSQQLQEVDAFWWIAAICILSAAFFAALFLGPVQ